MSNTKNNLINKYLKYINSGYDINHAIKLPYNNNIQGGAVVVGPVAPAVAAPVAVDKFLLETNGNEHDKDALNRMTPNPCTLSSDTLHDSVPFPSITLEEHIRDFENRQDELKTDNYYQGKTEHYEDSMLKYAFENFNLKQYATLLNNTEREQLRKNTILIIDVFPLSHMPGLNNYLDQSITSYIRGTAASAGLTYRSAKVSISTFEQEICKKALLSNIGLNESLNIEETVYYGREAVSLSTSQLVTNLKISGTGTSEDMEFSLKFNTGENYPDVTWDYSLYLNCDLLIFINLIKNYITEVFDDLIDKDLFISILTAVNDYDYGQPDLELIKQIKIIVNDYILSSTIPENYFNKFIDISKQINLINLNYLWQEIIKYCSTFATYLGNNIEPSIKILSKMNIY